jgi:hypothetical protein
VNENAINKSFWKMEWAFWTRLQSIKQYEESKMTFSGMLRRDITDDGIVHSLSRGNLKLYTAVIE